MGLQERRKVAELKDVTLPERVREIEEICGVAIPYEVDWDSMADDLEAMKYLDNLSCHRLNMALRVICMDEMGKAAVREGLKTVKLSNVKTASDIHVSFANGVLDMRCAYALGASGMVNDNDIRKVLENGL